MISSHRRRRVAAALAVVGGLTAAACSSGASDAHSSDHRASPVAESGGEERDYFIAADEVEWNYAPSGHNGITGEPFGGAESTWVGSGPDRIGPVYKKSVFRGYTDASFTTPEARASQWEHLGLLGPVVHAEVGDTIKVVFRNNTHRDASMHPHGVLYAKDSEGAPYDDGTSGSDKDDDAVAPGGTHTYVWKVPERAGPGPMDPSSIMWMYHSHADEVADTYAGLMGPIVVTKRGMARPDGSPKDVDRELVAMFMVSNENESPWIDDNIAAHTTSPLDKNEEAFQESNLMHAVNGYVFGNLPGVSMQAGAHVRWYVMGMGTEVDLHTPHWHGNTVVASGMRTDVVSLLPASMVVADMVPDDPGTWLFHCHVADHITAGMQATYVVT